MFIKSLSLRNFRTYRQGDLNLNQSQFTSIIGKNGVGKSNLLESIPYILFGKSRLKSEDENISDGSDDLLGDVTLNHRGNEIRVVRAKSRGKPATVDVYINSQEQESLKRKVREANAFIIELLGFDYDVFVATSFFRQKGADEFLSGTPAERKKYLNKILHLERFLKFAERASESQKETSVKLQQAQGSASAFRSLIAGVDLKALKQTLTSLDDEIKRVEDSIFEFDKELGAKDAELSTLTTNYLKREELRNLISDKLIRISEIASLMSGDEALLRRLDQEHIAAESKIETLQSDLENLRAEYSKAIARPVVDIKVQISTLELGIRSCEEQIRNTERLAPVCPECQQVVDESHKKKILDDLTDKISHYRSELPALREELEVANLKKDIKQKSEACQRDLEKAKSIVESSRRSEMLVRIQGHQSRLKSEQNSHDSCVVEHDSIECDDQKITTVRRDLQDLRIKKREFEAHAKSQRTSRDRLQEKINQFKEVQEKIAIVDGEISALDVKVQSYKELVEIFKTRIPALIIHDTLSSIMGYTNELLDSFNLRISAVIDTQATKSDGELRETLDIKIIRDGVERSYESYSGGQQDIINFCLRYSLSMILKSLQSTSIRSVYLDEIWSSLDPENRDAMLSALSIVRSSFDQVFAITHFPDMRDSFPAVIEVIENDGKSEVLV